MYSSANIYIHIFTFEWNCQGFLRKVLGNVAKNGEVNDEMSK